MEVSRGGKFSHTIGAKDLAQGLRKSKRAVRNSGTLITCQGAVGYDGVLQVIDEITRLATDLITDGHPYPQIFVFHSMIIICGKTDIYEWVDGALVHKLTVIAGEPWTAVAFYDYVYMSNNKVAVVRSAEDKTYSRTNDLPVNLAACNYNGQVIIYAPEVNPLLYIQYSPCFGSIDLYVSGGETFVFFPIWMSVICNICAGVAGDVDGMYSWIHDSQGRVFKAGTGMIADSADAKWSSVHSDAEIVEAEYIGAEVADDTFFITIGTNWVDFGTTYVWIVRNGVMTRVSIFPGDLDHMYYNNNPVSGITTTGHIVIPMPLGDYALDLAEVWVAVSHDYGESFNEVQVCSHDMSVNTIIFYEPGVQLDSSGTCWLVTFLRNMSDSSANRIHLYKSTTNGDSWSFVNEIVKTNAQHTRFFIDGTDLYIACLHDGTLYKSTNAGVTFNLISTFAGGRILAVGADGGVICVCTDTGYDTDAEIQRSIDGGSSYTSVKTLSEAAGYVGWTVFSRFRTSGNIWIYYAGALATTVEYLRLYLISYDNGVTWEDKISSISRAIPTLIE
jgi:hypothetical protein